LVTRPHEQRSTPPVVVVAAAAVVVAVLIDGITVRNTVGIIIFHYGKSRFTRQYKGTTEGF
jgi:hypothetical protein